MTTTASRSPSPQRPPARRFAVIGAGMAGVACARTLMQAGHSVSVFERQERPGGRMATQETPFGSFDAGAQFFTVRDVAYIDRMNARWKDRPTGLLVDMVEDGGWAALGRLAPADPRRLRYAARYESPWLARSGAPGPENEASMYWLARIRLEEATRLARRETVSRPELDDNFSRGLAWRARAGRYMKDLDPTLTGRALVERRQYRAALDLIGKIPPDEFPSARGWTVTAALLGLGRTNEAARAVEESLARPVQDGWRAALYTSWIQTHTALVRINADPRAADAARR